MYFWSYKRHDDGIAFDVTALRAQECGNNQIYMSFMTLAITLREILFQRPLLLAFQFSLLEVKFNLRLTYILCGGKLHA